MEGETIMSGQSIVVFGIVVIAIAFTVRRWYRAARPTRTAGGRPMEAGCDCEAAPGGGQKRNDWAS
jgi:hypothetical protein